MATSVEQQNSDVPNTGKMETVFISKTTDVEMNNNTATIEEDGDGNTDDDSKNHNNDDHSGDDEDEEEEDDFFEPLFRRATLHHRPTSLNVARPKKNTSAKPPKAPGEKRTVDKSDTIPDDVLENKKTQMGVFWTVGQPLNLRSQKLLATLLPFFTQEKLAELVVPRALKSRNIAKDYELDAEMAQQVNGISLRAIEWLVTNYSKAKPIHVYNTTKMTKIDIYAAYTDRSNYFRRCNFDPFCRSNLRIPNRLFFLWPLKNAKTQQMEDVVLQTSVAQLNFLQWAYENGVLQYAKTYQEEIQTSMESVLSVVNKQKRQCKEQKIKRKRQELTKPVRTICTVLNVPQITCFGSDDEEDDNHDTNMNEDEKEKRESGVGSLGVAPKSTEQNHGDGDGSAMDNTRDEQDEQDEHEPPRKKLCLA